MVNIADIYSRLGKVKAMTGANNRRVTTVINVRINNIRIINERDNVFIITTLQLYVP